MSGEELVRLLESGDTHGLLVAAVRHHAGEKFGEEWRGGVVFISRPAGEDHEQIVVTRRPAVPPGAA